MNPDQYDAISATERLVLSALYPRKELYGLQIPQAMSDVANGQLRFTIEALYPVLNSLEKRGHIESRWGEDGHDNRGGARRRYYKLTDQGIGMIDAIAGGEQNQPLQWQPT